MPELLSAVVLKIKITHLILNLKVLYLQLHGSVPFDSKREIEKNRIYRSAFVLTYKSHGFFMFKPVAVMYQIFKQPSRS